RAYSFLGIVSRVGAIVSIAAIGPMLTYWGLRTSFLLAGAPIVVLGVVALFVLREPVRGYFERKAVGADEEVARTEDEPQSFGEGWRATFAVRTLRRLFLSDIFLGCGEVVQIFLVFLLAEKYGLSALQTSYTLLPGAITGIVAGIYGGGLVDRFTGTNPGRVLTVYGPLLLM